MPKLEQNEQQVVASYISYFYPNILWTASAGGMRTTIGTAKKMKKMGYKRGCPDIIILEPNREYKGLFIELKCGGNKATKEQNIWITELNKRGYLAKVCYGSDETIKLVTEYLKNV
jgi:hypothetical protein